MRGQVARTAGPREGHHPFRSVPFLRHRCIHSSRRVRLVLTDAGLDWVDEVRRHVEVQHEDIVEQLGEENARMVQEALRSLISTDR